MPARYDQAAVQARYDKGDVHESAWLPGEYEVTNGCSDTNLYCRPDAAASWVEGEMLKPGDRIIVHEIKWVNACVGPGRLSWDRMQYLYGKVAAWQAAPGSPAAANSSWGFGSLLRSVFGGIMPDRPKCVVSEGGWAVLRGGAGNDFRYLWSLEEAQAKRDAVVDFVVTLHASTNEISGTDVTCYDMSGTEVAKCGGDPSRKLVSHVRRALVDLDPGRRPRLLLPCGTEITMSEDDTPLAVFFSNALEKGGVGQRTCAKAPATAG